MVFSFIEMYVWYKLHVLQLYEISVWYERPILYENKFTFLILTIIWKKKQKKQQHFKRKLNKIIKDNNDVPSKNNAIYVLLFQQFVSIDSHSHLQVIYPEVQILKHALWSTITVKFLNVLMPENFAIIYLKFIQRG